MLLVSVSRDLRQKTEALARDIRFFVPSFALAQTRRLTRFQGSKETCP